MNQPVLATHPPESAGLESAEVEKAVIGCLLLDSDFVVPKMQALKITSAHFHYKQTGMICQAIEEQIRAGKPVDHLTIHEVLRDKSQLGAVGGLDFLQECTNIIGSVQYSGSYLTDLHQAWLRRNAVDLGKEVVAIGETAENPGEELAGIPHKIFQLLETRDQKATRAQIIDTLKDRWHTAAQKRHSGEPFENPGLSTGMNPIDEALNGGLLPGTYVVLAARPSSGKTTMEDNWSSYLASNGIPVARATMDMTEERLLRRTACRLGGVSINKLENGYANSADLSAVDDALDTIGSWTMPVLDGESDLDHIIQWARLMKSKHDIQMLTVDYIQQVTLTYRGGKYQNENSELTEISKRFKKLAKELGIVVVMLSQLSRASESDNRRPKLSDLRGSGSIEQDGEIIILLSREYNKKYLPHQQDETGKLIRQPVFVNIAKQQDGGTGGLEYWLYGAYFRFETAEYNWGVIDKEDY